MIRSILLVTLSGGFAILTSCAPTSGNSTSASSGGSNDNPRAFPFHEFNSGIDHAPKLTGYRQVPSRSTDMRDAVIEFPGGDWSYSYDVKDSKKPIRITTASGKISRIDGIYYPEEGGADAAGVYGFIKDGETVIVLQGTSDMIYEETHLTFKGDTFVRARKYAVKGGGMGPEMPGREPKYRVYPPN